jgi:hypothetical protein
MNKLATLIIGFVLGGLVVGGAIYLSDSHSDRGCRYSGHRGR